MHFDLALARVTKKAVLEIFRGFYLRHLRSRVNDAFFDLLLRDNSEKYDHLIFDMSVAIGLCVLFIAAYSWVFLLPMVYLLWHFVLAKWLVSSLKMSIDSFYNFHAQLEATIRMVKELKFMQVNTNNVISRTDNDSSTHLADS
jgi:hypothetical protein